MPGSLLNIAAKSATEPGSTTRRIIDRAPELETNVGEIERIASLALGGGIAAWSLTSRRPSILGAVAGGALILRGLSGNCSLYRALGINTACGKGSQGVMEAGAGERVDVSVTIDKPVAEVYEFWRNFDKLPRFMTHLIAVEDRGNYQSHWVARGPLGVRVEWDAETITDRPNELISWKSLDGADVDVAGSVHFRAVSGGRGTEVRVTLKYRPPVGKLGAAAAKLFGRDPETQIREDLNRLKEILESNSGNAEARPNGNRQTAGAQKR